MEETTTLTNPAIETINNFFNNIFSSVDNSIYDLLDNLAFIDDNILKNASFSKLFGSASTPRYITCL